VRGVLLVLLYAIVDENAMIFFVLKIGIPNWYIKDEEGGAVWQPIE
jgi:hypothetical protein